MHAYVLTGTVHVDVVGTMHMDVVGTVHVDVVGTDVGMVYDVGTVVVSLCWYSD